MRATELVNFACIFLSYLTKEHMEKQCISNGLAACSVFFGQAAQAFVFATRTGNPLDYQRIYQTWLRIQKLSGVKKTIHTFRHTFATVGLAKGIPITEMSRILGHADVATTLNMYSHAIPDYNQKIIEMFNKK